MSDWADRSSDNLPARVASSVVLIGVGLGAAFAGGAWLAGATAAALTAMSFEYARMSERPRLGPAFVVLWLAALGAVMAASWGRFELSLACIAAGGLITVLRRRGGWVARGEAAFGVAYVGLPGAAFVWVRGLEEGLVMVLALFSTIWAADVAAYVGGRFIGGPKLAPSLSPNKTWTGLACGIAAGAGAGALAARAIPGGPEAFSPAWALAGAGFAAVGLMGDLFESMLKRRFGVKDASSLIPGHGGVLDRLDSLMAATLVAAACAALAPAATAAFLAGRG